MSSTMISLRMDNETLAAIDKAAHNHGETRTTYILSWIPEYQAHQGPTHQPAHTRPHTHNGQRTPRQHQR